MNKVGFFANETPAINGFLIFCNRQAGFTVKSDFLQNRNAVLWKAVLKTIVSGVVLYRISIICIGDGIIFKLQHLSKPSCHETILFKRSNENIFHLPGLNIHEPAAGVYVLL